MASLGGLKLLFVMLVSTVVVLAPHAEAAITCTQVVVSLTPCMGYLRSGGSWSVACCIGIGSLNSAAKTTADRQAACKCLKTAALFGQISGTFAYNLPGACGVKLPYQILTSPDCTKVQ